MLKHRYIIQTSVTPVLNTSHHATHTRNIPHKPSAAKPSHFLSTLTFIRTISMHFYTISQHHHSPQTNPNTPAISFHPIFTYLKSKPLRERRWACLPELLKLCLIYPVSLVPVCTRFLAKKSFRMSRWLASHTNVIPLWRLHELLAIRTTRMWIPHQQSRRVQYFLSPVHFTKQS